MSSVKSVCGRIWTFGALPHTTLAGWHHKPLGHANIKWMGQDSNLRCFCVTDLQSAALAARHTGIFSLALKKARKKLHLTQATCAELLDHSLSFQKDLERCRCSPSIENFYHICRTLNISADDCIFSKNDKKTDSTYHELLRLVSQCDEGCLRILTATATALLNEKQSASTWIFSQI